MGFSKVYMRITPSFVYRPTCRAHKLTVDSNVQNNTALKKIVQIKILIRCNQIACMLNIPDKND